MENKNQKAESAMCESCQIDPITIDCHPKNAEQYTKNYAIKKVVLYSTGCPRCTVLEKKLSMLGVEFEKNTSVDEMLSIGIKSAPVLSVDGKLLDFIAANEWLNHKHLEE